MSLQPAPSTLPEEEKTDNSPQLAKNLRRKFFLPGRFLKKFPEKNGRLLTFLGDEDMYSVEIMI